MRGIMITEGFLPLAHVEVILSLGHVNVILTLAHVMLSHGGICQC